MMQAVGALRQGRLADARVAARGAPAPARFVGGASRAGPDLLGGLSIRQEHRAARRPPCSGTRVTNARAWRSRACSARPAGTRTRERALQETIRVLPDSALARLVAWHRAMSTSIDLPTRGRNSNGLRQRRSPAAGTFYASIGRLASALGRLPARHRRIHARRRAHVPTTRRCTKSWPARSCSRTAPTRRSPSSSPLCSSIRLDADAHAGIGQIHLNAGRYTDAVDGAAARRRSVRRTTPKRDMRWPLR